MELRQKYTEVNNFEFEDQFLLNLRRFGIEDAIKIAEFLESVHYLDFISDNIMKYGGMVNITSDEVVFFELEFLKDLPHTTLLINIKPISVDDYLDYINLNLYLNPL